MASDGASAPEGRDSGPILVGWDAGAASRDALALALLIARECGYDLRIVLCYPDTEGYPEALGLIAAMGEDAQRKLDAVPQEAIDAGATRHSVIALSAAEGLQYEAEQTTASMIVLGSTHRGPLGRLVPGSVAENLLHGAPCAVTVAPRGYADAPSDALRIIAVGFDGSAESHAAVEHAVRLAEAARAGLKIISVAPTAPPFGWGAVAYSYDELRLADREDRRQKLADLAASLPSSLRPAERLRDGDPATEIVAECETAVDLLVLGSRGYGAFRRAMLGSVSTRVVREVSCPVMVVPQSSSKPAGPERRESRAVEA